MLRRIFACKLENVKEGWRKMHSQELDNLHSSANNMRAIRAREIRWVKHVVHM
jgi:hypothetical protein